MFCADYLVWTKKFTTFVFFGCGNLTLGYCVPVAESNAKHQTNTTMTTELQSLLAQSKMSATMVAEQIDITTDTSTLAIAAMRAGANADANPTPHSQKSAHDAAIAWIESNEASARRIIQRRIDARKARGITE